MTSSDKIQGISTQVRKLWPILFAVVLWLALSFHEQFFLKKVEDLSLFLFDWSFLRSALNVPGGFLGWAGSFFAQFLYYPWLGALLWVVLLVFSAWLTSKVFDIPENLSGIAYIPAFLLVISNMSLGYGIYIMRIQEYFFSPVLGYLLSLIPLLLMKRTEKTWFRLSFLAVWTLIGFPLFGAYGLWGTALASIGMISVQGGRSKRITVAIAALSLVIIVPILLYGCYTTYKLSDSWTMGIPAIAEDTLMPSVRRPLYCIAAFTVLAIIFNRPLSRLNGSGKHALIGQSAVIIMGIVLMYAFWFKDPNFRTELAMLQATDNFDWKQVTDIYSKASMKHIDKEKKAYEDRKATLSGVNDQALANSILDEYDKKFFEPTRLMVLLRDLSLLKQNKALDQAFTMRDGGRPQRGKAPLVYQVGRYIYLNYGIVNLEYRWCLEDQVEHGWSYGTFKYMAMYATLMNETEFASRYLSKLDKTLFYRSWSREHRILSKDAKAMAQAMPYREIIPYMCFDDRMSMDQALPEIYLMRHFANDRDKQATPEFDRAALLWAMRTQDITLFWKALSQYMSTSNTAKLPKHVQEAVLLYSSLENDDMGIPIDKDVKERYASFQNYAQQVRIRSERESAFQFWLKYGKTFFYYYYFVRNLQTF